MPPHCNVHIRISLQPPGASVILPLSVSFIPFSLSFPLYQHLCQYQWFHPVWAASYCTNMPLKLSFCTFVHTNNSSQQSPSPFWFVSLFAYSKLPSVATPFIIFSFSHQICTLISDALCIYFTFLPLALVVFCFILILRAFFLFSLLVGASLIDRDLD